MVRSGLRGMPLLWVTALLACGGEEPGPSRPAADPPPPAAATPVVALLEPADGAELAGGDVTVRLSASGIRITPAAVHEPGTAHHHLLLDVDPPPAGEPVPSGVTGFIHLGQGDSTFTFRDVAPGDHRLIALLGDSAHVPLETAVADTVRFTILERN